MKETTPCFVCPECKNTGLLDKDVYYTFCNLSHAGFCDCRHGKEALQAWCRTKEVQEACKIKRRKRVDKALEVSCLPTRWHKQSLGDLSQGPVKQKFELYFSQYPKMQKEGRGIYLCGKGDDKTCTLSILCREIIEKYATPCIFLSENQILGKIKDSFGSVQESSSKIIRLFQRIDCLFIDHFAAAPKITSWKYDNLLEIIEYRFHNRLPTFFASPSNLEIFRRSIVHSHVTYQPEILPSCIRKICQGFIIETK